MKREPSVGDIYELYPASSREPSTVKLRVRFEVIGERQGADHETRWPVKLDNGTINLFEIEVFNRSELVGHTPPPRPASMADQTKLALDNAERLLEHAGVYCARKLQGWWVLDAGARTVTGASLHEAFLELAPQSTVGDGT